MVRWIATVAAVALLVVGCAGSGGEDPGLAGSPSPPVETPSATEESPTTDSSTTEPSRTADHSPTTEPPQSDEPSPPAPVSWGAPELLAEDSRLPVRATAVGGPGGFVGHSVSPRGPEGALTALLLRSSDGTSWDVVLEQDALEIDGLLAGGAGYVVIGTRHLPPGEADLALAPWAAWSADGLTWQEVDVPHPSDEAGDGTTDDGPRVTGTWFDELVATPSGFVALGHGTATGNRNVLWTSRDGTAWELAPGDPFVGEATVRGIASGDDGYVAYGNAQSPGDAPGPLLAWHSDDGLTWTRAVGHETFVGPFGEGPSAAGVVAFRGGFVMVDVGIVSPPRAWSSADGREWEAPVTLPSLGERSATVSTVAAGGGRILAAGREIVDDEGLGPGVQYPGLWGSADGRTWEQVPPEELRGDLTHDGVSIGVLAPLDDGWLALGSVWDHPDERPTAVAWTGR